jgi:hypothetical protein
MHHGCLAAVQRMYYPTESDVATGTIDVRELRRRVGDELLGELTGMVPNNSVTATLNLEEESGDEFTLTQHSTRETVDQVAVGSHSFSVEVME